MNTSESTSKPSLSYTSRDYNSIYNDLVNSIPSLTKIWNSRDENDPGIVLVKLMAALGDNLSYYLDRTALEMYPSSVTQRKNAKEIFRLIGYRMKGYVSSTVNVTFTNQIPENIDPSTEVSPIYINKYATLATSDNSITYTVLEDGVVAPGKSITLKCVEGKLITETLSPDKFNSKNRYYFSVTNVDESNISLSDNRESWTKVDNTAIYGQGSKSFEFGIDEYDLPYIQLVPYWKELISSNSDVVFRLSYFRSSGSSGSIESNSLNKFVSGNPKVTNTTLVITHPKSTSGADPESPSEVKLKYGRYIHTLDTIVTLTDLENATRTIDEVANCRATDFMYDPTVEKPYSAKLYLVMDYDYNTPLNNIDPETNPDEYNLVYGLLLSDVHAKLSSYKVASWKLYGTDMETEPMTTCAPLYADWYSLITLHLSHPVTEKESNALRLKVLNNMINTFQLRNVQFSHAIKYSDVMKVVMNTDRSIIKTADVGPITYLSNNNFQLPVKKDTDPEVYSSLYYKKLITIPRYMPFSTGDTYGGIIISPEYVINEESDT